MLLQGVKAAIGSRTWPSLRYALKGYKRQSFLPPTLYRVEMSTSNFKDHKFGPWTVHASEIFATSSLSFAFVNLKPIVRGHVLISPRRVVNRFTELTSDEVADIWHLAQKVSSRLEAHLGASSLTLTIQDGPQAGQTVPHVHIHILPRRAGDFEKNDEIYDVIDAASKEFVREKQGEAAPQNSSLKVDADAERKSRTPQEMAAEAAELRTLF
ncbi:hypothetical protein ACKKBF_B09605 [Auxenochlorella protothecoides x Auxenochlorella symbiontica]